MTLSSTNVEITRLGEVVRRSTDGALRNVILDVLNARCETFVLHLEFVLQEKIFENSMQLHWKQLSYFKNQILMSHFVESWRHI